MWSISAVKTRGREAFKANYWMCVLVGLIYGALVGWSSIMSSGGSLSVTGAGAGISGSTESLTQSQEHVLVISLTGLSLFFVIVFLVVKALFVNPVEVGCTRFFRNNVIEEDVGLRPLKEGFENYGHALTTLLRRDILVFLWSLLLFVPGIVKSYSYRMVPYIVRDEPQLSSSEVLRRSSELMRGNRWRSFVLDLSFAGWYLLSALTLGLGMLLWVNPYVQSTNAALYLELRDC